MPKLGEVIGAMLSDVARARVRADLESLRIAEAYSRDPLLKHLSVPRFRLPELVVDLPVLVSGVDDSSGTGDAWSVGEPTKAELGKAIQEAVTGSDVKLTKTQVARATSAAAERSGRLFTTGDRPLLSPGTVAAELADAVVGSVATARRELPEGERKALSAATTASVTALLSRKLVPASSVDVSVTSGEIKAHGDGGSVVRLRLTITEDSYELVNRDDGQGYFLTPE